MSVIIIKIRHLLPEILLLLSAATLSVYGLKIPEDFCWNGKSEMKIQRLHGTIRKDSFDFANQNL